MLLPELMVPLVDSCERHASSLRVARFLSGINDSEIVFAGDVAILTPVVDRGEVIALTVVNFVIVALIAALLR